MSLRTEIPISEEELRQMRDHALSHLNERADGYLRRTQIRTSELGLPQTESSVPGRLVAKALGTLVQSERVEGAVGSYLHARRAHKNMRRHGYRLNR